jgi:hypothetical protein
LGWQRWEEFTQADVSDGEWAFGAPWLTLMRGGAPQREDPLLDWPKRAALVGAGGLPVGQDREALARTLAGDHRLVLVVLMHPSLLAKSA